MATHFWSGLAQLVLDAVDVDLRAFQHQLADRMRRYPNGRAFAEWANENPMPFEMLIRALLVIIKRQTRSLRSKGMVADAIADQLANLPYEFRRAFGDPPSNERLTHSQVSGSIHNAEPSLAQLLPFFREAREQGEFCGAFVRELLRGLEPDEFDGLIRQLERYVDERLNGSRPSSFSVSQKKRLLSQFSDDFPSEVSHELLIEELDQPLYQEFNSMRARSFLHGLRSPASFSPQVSNFSILVDSVSKTFAFFRTEWPGEFTQLVELKSSFAELRNTWMKERRPEQWLLMLSFVEAAI